MTNFITLLLGFFLAINLSTILGQTGDWGLLTSSLIVATIETTSYFMYKIKKKIQQDPNRQRITVLNKTNNLLNNIKIGMLYGFFVEAFKLGS